MGERAADLVLVTVHGRAVEVAVACIERGRNCGLHLAFAALPCAEADEREFCAIGELDGLLGELLYRGTCCLRTHLNH